MDAALEARINKIIDSGFETPSALKRVLKEEMALIKQDQQNRDILGLVFVETTYINTDNIETKFTGAYMILATTTGLIIVQEGLNSQDLKDGGYRVRYVPYYKISCVELDSCLLLGIFELTLSGTLNDPDIAFEFDTADRLQDFEDLAKIIRRKMTSIQKSLEK